MIFKICGLKEKDSIICCETNNVDFFGLIFYEKSPRNVDARKAKELIKFSKNLNIKPVGVFVNKKINDLKEIISNLSLNYIQLHGDENQAYIDQIKNEFKIKIIKNISIENESDLKKINNLYNIDYLLFDLHTETFGQVFNYVVTLTIIHHFILFSLDNFSFQNMGTVLLNTLYSSVFTLTLYFAGSYILREKQLN